MAVLKKFFSSLKKLFGQKRRTGRNKKKQQKTKRRVGKKLLSRRRVLRKSPKKSRPVRPSRKIAKKKQGIFSAKKSLRPGSVPVQSPSGKTQPSGQLIGEVTHFFSKIQVIVVKIGRGDLAVGNKIRISSPQAPAGQRILPRGGPMAAGRRKATDFTQTVRSMQIESVDVRSARSGQLIGLKVEREARVGDKLYKLV